MKKGDFYLVYTDYIGSLLGISGGFVRVYLRKIQNSNDFLEDITVCKEYESIILKHIKNAWDKSREQTKATFSLEEHRKMQEDYMEISRAKDIQEEYFKMN